MNHVSNVHMIPEWTRMSDLWHLQDHTYAVCRPPSPAVVIPFDIEDISCNTTVVTSSNVSQDVWEGSITRCICGFSHDDGFMICCDQCSVWQHVDCMGISRSAIPDEYLCEYCDPRPVDVPSAIRIQTKARKRLHSQGVNSDVSNSSGDESSEQVRQPQPTVKKPVSRVNTRLVEPTKTIRQEAPAINTVTSSRTFIVDKAAKSRVVDGELESAPLQTPVRRRRLSSVRASVELSDTSRHSTGTASNSEDELCIPAQKLSREEKKIQACMKMFEKMEKSRARHKDSVQDTNKPVKSTQKPTVKPGDDSCTDTSKRDVAVAKTVVNAEDDKNLNCAIEGRVDKKNTTAAAISRDETVANLLSVVDVDSDLDSIPIQQRLDRQRRCAVADDVKPSVCELDKFDSNLCKSSGFTEVLKREISDSCSEPVLATPLSNADRSTIAALQKTATIKLTEDILATDVKSEKFFDCKAGILEEKSKGENFVDSPLCCVVAGTGSTVMKAESLDANIGEHTTVKMVKGKTIKKSKDEMLSSEDEESSVSGAKLVSPNRSKTVTDGTENRTVLSGKVGSANEGDNTDAPSTKSAEPAAAELEGVDSDGCGCDLPLKSEEDKAAADDCQPNSSTASSSVKCKRLAGDSKTRALQRLKRLSPHTSSPRMSTRMSTRLSIAAAATTASTSSTFDKASFYLKRPPQRTKPLFTSVSPLIVLSPLRHTAGSRYSDSSQGHAFAKKRWLMQAISETTSSSASDSNVKVSHSDGELAPANFLSPSGSGMSTPLKKRRLTLESTDAAGSEGFSSPEYPHPGSSMSLRTPLSETLRAYSNLFERISTERQSTGESPNQSSAGLQSQAVTSTGSDSPGTSDNGRRGAGDGTASVDSTTTDGEESAETSSKSQQAAAACRSSHLTPRKRYMRMEVEQWERQDRDDSTDSKTAVDSTLECNEISSTDSASVGGFKSPPTDQQPSMLRGQSWLEDGSLMGNVVTSAALKCDLDGAENLQPNALPPPSSVDQSVGQPLPVFGEPTISPPCGIDDSGNRVEPGQDRRRLSSKDQGDDVMSPLLLEGETMSSAEPSRSFGIADESVSAQAVKRKMSLAEYRTRHHLDSSSSNKSCTVTQPTMPVHRPVTPPVETVADITVFSSLSDSPGPSEIRHIGKRWNLAATAAEQMLSLTDRLRFEFGVDAADDSIGSTESDVLADVPTEVTCSTPSAPLGVISSPKQSSSSSSWAVAMTSSSLSSAVPVLLASERRSSQYRSPTVLESSRLQPAPLRTNARSQLSPVSPQLPFHSPPLPPHLLSPPPQSLSSAERLRLHPSEQTESCRQLSQATRQVSHQQSEELVPDQPLRLALNRMSTPHQQPSALPRSPSPQNSTELSQKEAISRWSSAFSRQPPDFPLSVPRSAPALQQQAPPFLPRSPPQKPAELSPDSVTVPHMSSAFTRQRVPALAEELQLFGPRSPTLQQPSAVDSFLESRSATLKLPSTHPANLQPSLPQKQQLSHPSQQPLLRLTPPPVSPPKSINEFKAANDDYRRKAASQQTFVQAKSKTLLHVEPLPSQHQQGSSLEPAVGSRQPALSRPELYNQRATTHPLAMKPIEAQRTDLAPKPDTIETTSPGSTLLQRLPPRPVLSAPLAQELKNSQSKPPRLPSVGLSTQPETTFIGGVAAAPGLLPPAVQPPHQPFPVEQLNPQTALPRLMLPSPLSVPRPREPIASPATPVGGPWMGIRPPLPSPPPVPVPMAMTLPPPLLPPLELVDVTRPPPPLPFQTAVGVPVYHGEHPVPVFRPPDLPREPLVPPPFPPSLGLPVAPPLPPPLPQDSTESEMLPPPLPPSPPPASPPEPADSSARSRAHRLASRRAEKKLRRKLRKREQTDVTPPAFSSSSQRDGSKSHLSDGSVWHSCRQWSENIDDQKREDDDVAGSNSGGQYNVNTSAVRRSSQHEIEGDKGLLNESSRTRRAVGDQFAADQRRPWNQTVHRKTVDGVDSHCNDRGGSGLSGRVQLHNDDGRHSIESRDRSSVNVDQTPGCGRRGDMWLSRADTRRMERDGGEEHWQPARLTSAGRFDRVSDGNADRDESNETDESGGDTAAGGHSYMAGHRKHAGQLCSSSNAPSERRPVDKSGNPTVPSLMNNHRRPVSGHRSHVAGPRGFFQPRSSPTSRSGFSGPRVVRPLMSLSATPTRPGIGGAQLSARSHRESPLPQTTTRISSPDAGRDVSSSSSSEHCKVTSCNEFESELREDCMYGAPPPRRRGEFSSGGRLHTNRGLREGGVSGFDRY